MKKLFKKSKETLESKKYKKVLDKSYKDYIRLIKSDQDYLLRRFDFLDLKLTKQISGELYNEFKNTLIDNLFDLLSCLNRGDRLESIIRSRNLIDELQFFINKNGLSFLFEMFDGFVFDESQEIDRIRDSSIFPTMSRIELEDLQKLEKTLTFEVIQYYSSESVRQLIRSIPNLRKLWVGAAYMGSVDNLLRAAGIPDNENTRICKDIYNLRQSEFSNENLTIPESLRLRGISSLEGPRFMDDGRSWHSDMVMCPYVYIDGVLKFENPIKYMQSTTDEESVVNAIDNLYKELYDNDLSLYCF